MPKVELDELELSVSPLTNTVYAMIPDKRATKGKPYKIALHKRDVMADFWNCVVARFADEESSVIELRVDGELYYEVELRDMRAGRVSDPKGAEGGSSERSEESGTPKERDGEAGTPK